MDTLVLTRSEIKELLSPADLLAALRTAFAAYSTQRTIDAMRIPIPLPGNLVPAGASGTLLAPVWCLEFPHIRSKCMRSSLGVTRRYVACSFFMTSRLG